MRIHAEGVDFDTREIDAIRSECARIAQRTMDEAAARMSDAFTGIAGAVAAISTTDAPTVTLTTGEYATREGISVRTARWRAANQRVRATRVGRQWAIHAA